MVRIFGLLQLTLVVQVKYTIITVSKNLDLLPGFLAYKALKNANLSTKKPKLIDALHDSMKHESLKKQLKAIYDNSRGCQSSENLWEKSETLSVVKKAGSDYRNCH